MHIDVARAYFHAKAQRLVLVRLPVEDRMGADAGNIRLLKKSMYGTRTLQAIESVIGKCMSKAGAFNLGSIRRICLTRKSIKFQECNTKITSCS